MEALPLNAHQRPTKSIRHFPTGKLPQAVLARLLDRYGRSGERVLVGPRIGEDCAVIDFGDTYLVAKTDPITFATEEIGWYAVHINANDLAAMGAHPKWFLVTILLPEGVDESSVEQIFASLHRAASELDIALCGGHTEITHGLDRPLLVGQMLGEVPKDRLIQSSGARIGDAILLTKGLAIEATAIIAREKAHQLRGQYDEAFIEQCARYLYDPGISVLREAQIACEVGSVHAMHDPTEGGVATGLRELALASRVGMEIFREGLFLSDESRLLCDAFGLDPLGVISSGALLIVVASEDTHRVRNAIRGAGTRCEWIGTITETAYGVCIRGDGGSKPLSIFERDEIARLFEEE